MARLDPAKIVGLPPSTTKSIQRAIVNLEHALLKTEDWLQLAAQGSELGLWYWDEVKRALHWDIKTREMFGVSGKGKVTLQTFVDALHPKDRRRVVRHWRRCFEQGLPYSIDLRSVRPDKTVRWIHARGKGYYNRAGTPLYMIGVVFDVTDRKEAEQERFDLSGRLINAQEEERRHLARELHDDFSQKIALLAVELESIAGMTKDSPPAASKRIQQLAEVVKELGSDLHAVSHRLHSSNLEILGLGAAVASHCKEVAKQHRTIRINFEHKNLPPSIHQDAALCLLRILQEGLGNVIKHSRASKVDVWLEGNGDAISLGISDDGVGCELSKNYASDGIGIHSMKERARMLSGTFEIQSQPGRGTKISVTVPFTNMRAVA